MTQLDKPLIVPGNLAILDPRREEFIREEMHIHSWLLQKRSAGTRRNYRREIRSFFTLFPGLLLRETVTSHLVAFLTTRSHLSPAAVNFSKNALSSLFRYCVKVGYLGRSPADALDSITVPRKVAYRSLTLDEVKQIALKTRDFPRRDRLLIRLLFASGMRVREAVELKWEYFRVNEKVVQMIIVGKGQKVRTLNLARSLYEELLTLREQPQHEMSDFVFASQKAPYSHISTTHAWRIVKLAAAAAKLSDKISPHFFRHAHATLALHSGAPISTVQHSLGHASLSTTGIYLDAFPDKTSGEYLPDID